MTTLAELFTTLSKLDTEEANNLVLSLRAFQEIIKNRSDRRASANRMGLPCGKRALSEA